MHPFTHQPDLAVTSLGEVALLQQIQCWLGPANPPSPVGMGDDCAVLPPSPSAKLFASDSLVYLRHFDDSVAAADAGAKLLKRNLSDLAAMGGSPVSAVVASFLPPSLSLAWLEAFTRGLAECALQWRCPIVGGDLTETQDFLGFNLTILGHTPNKPLLRQGAQAGDRLYVTGALGGTLASHHLTFTPRIPEGRFLAQTGGVTALIDITDGLAKDLPALLPPGTQARLRVDQLPIRPTAHAAAQISGLSPTEHALRDGEDYELLFALRLSGEAAKAFERSWRQTLATPLTCIGHIGERQADEPIIAAADTGTNLLSHSGYEHFR